MRQVRWPLQHGEGTHCVARSVNRGRCSCLTATYVWVCYECRGECAWEIDGLSHCSKVEAGAAKGRQDGAVGGNNDEGAHSGCGLQNTLAVDHVHRLVARRVCRRDRSPCG